MDDKDKRIQDLESQIFRVNLLIEELAGKDGPGAPVAWAVAEEFKRALEGTRYVR